MMVTCLNNRHDNQQNSVFQSSSQLPPVKLSFSRRQKEKIREMALKFGPQWLRDLSDGGANGPQPGTPTLSVKFKLADYRYGREEMLSLFHETSPPPDQVRKHLSIFSTEIQKPITMLPLTEDEQRLVSQGFNSTLLLRNVGRSSGPPLRASRGGGTADRSRGRGRGRGEGYNIRTENGEVGYSRQTQDGWEHVGRKFERSYSRGYDESGTIKREFSRSSSDNWRDKRHDDEEDDDGGAAWRNTRDASARWGPSTRSNWREPQRDVLGFEGDRRPLPPRRGFDQDAQVPRRTSESYDNEGEVPEWVEDDVGDDPGTFDSSGAFVSTKEGKKYSDTRPDAANTEGSEKKTGNQHSLQMSDHTATTEPHNSNTGERVSLTQAPKPPYIPPNARNGTGDVVDCRSHDQSKSQLASIAGQPDSFSVLPVSNSAGTSNKGDGDTGFSFANKKDEETNGNSTPSEHYTDTSTSAATLQPPGTGPKLEQAPRPRLTNPEFLHMEKSLQNLVASMAADHRDGRQLDVSQGALPLTHEHSNKWFYNDPQGEVQGPFTNEEMSQWFSAGFFTLGLLIKRGCDDSFKPLGDLIKRYNRLPFLPGPPLPPLISNISPEPAVIPSSPLTIPSFVSSTPATPLAGPGLPSVSDPLILQHMLLQQEYLKQSFLMRQIQTLHQMQEQDSFKSLSPEQQQHLSMQMMAQTNPVFMQHFQQLQQQQLLLQQQQEQQKVATPTVTGEGPPGSFPQPPSSVTSATTASLTTTTNTAASEKPADESSTWASLQQYLMPAGVWSQSSSQQVAPPTSLWDIDVGNGNMTPAYLAQLDKITIEKKQEKLKEEERLRQDELEKKREEIMRQQEELERQMAQMRREKEELERQKQTELLKMEEAKRQEEERIRQEIEQQKQEKQAEERRKAEEEKKRLEEERKREQKLEEKKKKEEDKRRQQEEHKKQQAELRRKKEEELQQQQEWQRQQLEALRLQKEEEEERVQREAAEREKLEAQKRQQELQKQQEAQRRLQQAQRDQLANIQLPASTNWAAPQQNVQGSPTQSRSLTDIQEEEARKAQEQERELHQLQRLQEQVYLKNQQQQQQKSWATHMSQAAPTKGVSLLDIQLQEQESAKKSQKEKPSTQTYQAKVALSLASTPTWTGTTSGGTWSSQSVWNSSYTSTTSAIWDQVANQPSRKSAVKESGEFPALKNQAPQVKKNSDKPGKPKVAGAKLKKEEESVQKLFQTRQQDDFSQWVMEHVSSFCAPIDVPTFVSFIVEVDSPDDVREYMKTYLGDTKESRDFARQFVEKRNYFRNQARLEKQQEEDSIWGPAPAINPHSQTRVGGGGNNSNSASDGGESGKGKNRKKKQKMQKLDGSILGFTVHADPNRKNAAGEVESIQ